MNELHSVLVDGWKRILQISFIRVGKGMERKRTETLVHLYSGATNFASIRFVISSQLTLANDRSQTNAYRTGAIIQNSKF